MYAFHSDKDVKPSGVFCLEGCFVEPVNHEDRNSKMKYGIEISLSQDNSTSRFLYTKDEHSRNEWCVAIRHAARQFVFEVNSFIMVRIRKTVNVFFRIITK